MFALLLSKWGFNISNVLQLVLSTGELISKMLHFDSQSICLVQAGSYFYLLHEVVYGILLLRRFLPNQL